MQLILIIAAGILLACVLLLVFFLGNKVVWKKLGFFGALVMLAVVVMANVFAWTQHQELNARSGAVVMSSSVVVKSTPNESGTDLFVLHEGTRVNGKSHLLCQHRSSKGFCCCCC